jgi:gas vesicle protein
MSMTNATNNIYNTNIYTKDNNSKYNTIQVIDDDSINIYSIYHTLRVMFADIDNKIKRLYKKMDKLIKLGGPSDVKAQTYDSPKASSSIVENVSQYYQDLVDVKNEILNQEKERNRIKKQIEDVVETILDIAKLRKNDIEFIVFVEHHVKGRRLVDISKNLYRKDTYGRKIRYDYGYIRNVNSMIIEKMRQM